MSSPEPPHFMKIIVAHTKEIEMLKIPTKFARQHGDSLSNTLCLRVPNGGMWKVNVVKNDGDLWLQNGWKEFAQYYSLEYGSLLLFRYNGNSNFWVLIFDKTASEIDYPIHNIQAEVPHLEDIDCQNDLPDDNLDEGSLHHKRRKMNSSDSHFATIDTKSNVLKVEKFTSRSDRSRQDLGVSPQENGGSVSGCMRLWPKVPAKTKTLSSRDKTRALLGDEAFLSDEFKVTLCPSYLGSRMAVPMKFARRFLTQKNGDVTLSVSDEIRKWPVKYIWNVYDKGSFVTFICGWSAFVKDNSLKVNDVCVFKLINFNNFLFKVVISQDTSDPNCPLSLDESKGDRVRKRMTEHKVEPSEASTDSLDDFSPMQKREGKVRNDQLTPEEISIRRRSSLTAIAKTLEPAGQSNPSFPLVISESTIQHRIVYVPDDFVKELTQKRPAKLMLKVADKDKRWPVNLLTYAERKTGMLSGGFGAFLRDNNIQAGDGCVFELIDKDGSIVNVTVSRSVV